MEIYFPFGERGKLALREDGTLQCHACGNWFRSVASHIRIHGITADRYKEGAGLQKSIGLVSDSTYLNLARRSQNRKLKGARQKAAPVERLIETSCSYCGLPIHHRLKRAPLHCGSKLCISYHLKASHPHKGHPISPETAAKIGALARERRSPILQTLAEQKRSNPHTLLNLVVAALPSRQFSRRDAHVAALALCDEKPNHLDAILSRLVRRGALVRKSRGLYVKAASA